MITEILVILDRSGSMESAKSDHEGGLKSFVADQQRLPGDVRFSLVQFDTVNPCEVVYDHTPIADVQGIELTPRGGTPLLDAVGKAVAHFSSKVAADATVVVLVITDGEENQSREWTKAKVADLVKEREAAGWTFLFLGANMDAFAEAGSMGFSSNVVMDYNNYDAHAINRAYTATSMNVFNTMAAEQSMRSVGASASALKSARTRGLSYTADQRAAAMGQQAVQQSSTTSVAAPVASADITKEE